jgi:hypothetical protein
MILDELPYPESGLTPHMIDRYSYISGYNQAIQNAKSILRFVASVPDTLPTPAVHYQ